MGLTAAIVTIPPPKTKHKNGKIRCRSPARTRPIRVLMRGQNHATRRAAAPDRRAATVDRRTARPGLPGAAPRPDTAPPRRHATTAGSGRTLPGHATTPVDRPATVVNPAGTMADRPATTVAQNRATPGLGRKTPDFCQNPGSPAAAPGSRRKKNTLFCGLNVTHAGKKKFVPRGALWQKLRVKRH
jgi:hypothetical protein